MKFAPFAEEPSKIENEDYYYRYPQAGNPFSFALGSPLEDDFNRAKSKLVKDFFYELDGVICCMMAAGVSADKIITTTPVLSVVGNKATIDCYLGCRL